MKNKTALILVFILLATNILLIFFLFKKGGGRKGGQRQIAEKIANDIGFDKQQKEKFVVAYENTKAQSKQLMDSIGNIKKEYIEKLMLQPNDSNLHQYTEQIANLILKIDHLNFKNLQASKIICTPSQIPIYDSIVKKIMMRLPGRNKNNKN